MICYLAVFVVAIRLRHDIHASLPILIVGTLVMLLVIVGFIYSLWSQGSRALIWIIGSLLLSLIVAMVMKRNKPYNISLCAVLPVLLWWRSIFALAKNVLEYLLKPFNKAQEALRER